MNDRNVNSMFLHGVNKKEMLYHYGIRGISND